MSSIAVMTDLESAVEAAWESRASLSPQSAPAAVRDAVAQVIDELDRGRLRVAEKRDGVWTTHQWIKKAVLLSFRLAENTPMRFGRQTGSAEPFAFYDKVPNKFAGSPTRSSPPPAFASFRPPSCGAARSSRRMRS
jgi:2,3,4,5-tetrahydropyridine-2-carboxylate N-succinyltransferase